MAYILLTNKKQFFDTVSVLNPNSVVLDVNARERVGIQV